DELGHGVGREDVVRAEEVLEERRARVRALHEPVERVPGEEPARADLPRQDLAPERARREEEDRAAREEEDALVRARRGGEREDLPLEHLLEDLPVEREREGARLGPHERL